MVMDVNSTPPQGVVNPSPQSVGREFVRQYYTLLHEAPTHLHRFYNNNSLFVHGGQSNPVVGQKQIHQCIQQLNFSNCHAKITQVDSQATLANGVVVQVTGELSNGGQPMRPFTQTFVLAAQSPKQYYVHNDIFRYRDNIFTGNNMEESRRIEKEDLEPEVNPQELPQNQIVNNDQNIGGYYVSGGGVAAVNGTPPHVEEPVPVPSQPVPAQIIQVQQQQPPPQPTPGIYPSIDIIQQQQPPPPPPPQQQLPQQQLQQPQPTPQQPPPQMQVQLPSPQQQVQVQPQQQQQPPPVVQSGYQSEECEADAEADVEADAEADEEEEEEVGEPALEPEEEKSPVPPPDQEQPVHDTASSNEPKTYASTLVKSAGGGSSFSTSPSAPVKSPSSPPPMSRIENRNNEINSGGRGGGPRVQRGGSSIRGMGRGGGGERPLRSNFQDDNGIGRDDSYSGDGDRRRQSSQQYPDTHQLFVGNLPLSASEDTLKSIFSKFGTIVDLRIMNKSNNKGSNGNKPNYSFISFESISSVETVLKNRPIYFPGENQVKLNVEEKKVKPPRNSMDGRMGSGSDGRGGARPMMMRGGMAHRGNVRGSFMRGGGEGGRGTMRMNSGPAFNQRGGPR